MKKSILGLVLLFSMTSMAHASGSITAMGMYGGFRSLGKETIINLKDKIEIECSYYKKGKLLSKIECMGFSSGSKNYRICSAVCSEGRNTFLNYDGTKIDKINN